MMGTVEDRLDQLGIVEAHSGGRGIGQNRTVVQGLLNSRRADHRFQLVPFCKILLETTAAYLVQGIIPREGLVVVWGPPKCGKSFWTFDLVIHVGGGQLYRGRRVKQGAVVYVACEGERGLRARVEAFRRRALGEGKPEPDFYLIATRLDLVADRQLIIDDIRVQLGDMVPVAVVIDTLNRSIAGSESSDEDMGAYVKAADAVREVFRCAVMIIHHCGTDDRRPRGHTSLTGAADAQIAVRRETDGTIVATVEWLKDGAEGVQIRSRLEIVDLGQDDDGEALTSCVIVPADVETATPARRALKGTAKVAHENLLDCVARFGEPAPASDHIPRAVRGVTKARWREHLEKGGIINAKGNPREQLRRLVVTLKDKGILGAWEDFVWPIT
jgi:hypothetical protein